MNHKNHIFTGMVTAMDSAIGNVVQALKKTDLYNDTLIIFTSDVSICVKQ